MNLEQRPTKKCLLILLTTVFTICFTYKLFSQKEYTAISKNINPDAQDLYHDLSPQGDSLYLKSYASIFYKVTFLNSLDRKVYTFNPPLLETKISLYDIIVGDYTVLVYEQDKIIVFHISRILEIEKPKEELIASGGLLSERAMTAEVNPLERSVVNVRINELQMNEVLDSNSDPLRLAMNDGGIQKEELTLIHQPRAYNLSEANREGMQTREEYRRNTLRPNGKPYD